MPNPPYTMADLLSFGYIAGPANPGTVMGIGTDNLPAWLTTFNYNVKDYGAVGNGTHDDTTAIQDTIDACIAERGGAVYLPAGVYLITSPLTFANMSGTWEGLTFAGAGSGIWTTWSAGGSTQIKNASGDSAVLAYADGENATINGLQLRDFFVKNTGNLPSTAFTIECSAVMAGLGVRNVILEGGGHTGNGFRHSVTDGQWTLDRLMVHNFSGYSVGIEITDGHDPAWGHLRGDSFTSQGGNGFLNSCMVHLCYTGYHFVGDNIGIGGMANKAIVSGYGFKANQLSCSDLLACHVESALYGYVLDSLCRGNRIKGLHSGLDHTALGVYCDGEGNDIEIVEMCRSGAMPHSIELGANSIDNTVHCTVRPSTGTVTTKYNDSGTDNHLGW